MRSLSIAEIRADLESMMVARTALTEIITSDATTPVERARAFASLRRLAKARDRMEAAFTRATGIQAAPG